MNRALLSCARFRQSEEGGCGVWVWGGCCCDFDFVGLLYGVCNSYSLLLISINIYYIKRRQ